MKVTYNACSIDQPLVPCDLGLWRSDAQREPRTSVASCTSRYCGIITIRVSAPFLRFNSLASRVRREQRTTHKHADNTNERRMQVSCSVVLLLYLLAISYRTWVFFSRPRRRWQLQLDGCVQVRWSFHKIVRLPWTRRSLTRRLEPSFPPSPPPLVRSSSQSVLGATAN